MIWLLFILLIIFTYINYKIADGDIFNPSVIFSAMFLLFSFFCCLANLTIGIDIEETTTIAVIMVGILIFTFFNCLYIIILRRSEYARIFKKII